MPKTALLRFRDHSSDIDTIQEHIKIIDKYKYTWWGWWKKQSEPDHRSDLEELKYHAKKEAITVGLFDRSTDRYFFARATDFIPPIMLTALQ
jgi:hypothetical protein